ncbi:aspartyl-tRNA(Asn)/glutamyl-tRNA(Gln) amidotransferase subunit A [Modicisalibacter ilicicola DSM 19980]|uniref:Aspartyl-tRNA(Asn)/glutamyl-tRNA(Gln) amidotransferase subunit A n=1 Tax=Modicisalibacter ilicicola DSM 19980 TaxID=1121942 RepID=A0A1M5CG96_9GAMM|nr:amidase [Halomonas ilicicola]SHF53696.1 aspartyl-tRNA(Asn)/glutamyl-tRNA(Gln) amidotransferase subunit A [Halomonas ilicicola DSM 19980]
MHPTLNTLLKRLQSRQHNATELLDDCLARIAERDDGRIHTALFEASARAQAEACDRLYREALPQGPLAGLPIAIKALFDVTGAVTHAGSRLLADAPPATRDASAVERLRQSGAILTGHTNMTEFAYSGLGLNPHYGTPDNPVAPGRIPGGSSSGAAVAVAEGMAAAALGTDTGGSVRIPAAFCGLVGFKPSQYRVPLEGALPLSCSLDSIGPIAPSVDCCARLDAVLSGEPMPAPGLDSVKGLRLAVPGHYLLEDIDSTVAVAFERALASLSAAGAVIREIPLPQLLELPELLEGGGFTAAESYHVHRDWLAEHCDRYDPRVGSRIQRGADLSAADYLELQRRRRFQVARMDRLLQDVDALVSPTVPVVPPLFVALEQDEDYSRTNLLVLRNPTAGNLLDLCAISLPCHWPDELPVGLMLMARNGMDHALLRQAAGVEAVLASSGRPQDATP